MSLWDPEFNKSPPPYYYPGQPLVTIVIYHGGKFSEPSSMRPTYIGGSVNEGVEYEGSKRQKSNAQNNEADESENPKRNVKGFRQDVIKDINVHVSRNQAYRCKWKALKKIDGNTEDQYGRMWDYAEELRTSNPGSTIILSMAAEDGSGTPRGSTYKKALWKAAFATTVPEFETRIQEMIKLDKAVVEWLNDKPPMHWSSKGKTDLQYVRVNREWLMGRLQESRDKCAIGRKWNGKICPKIKAIIKKRSEKVRDCIPMKSTDLLYEIECYDATRCVVDLGNWTCSCTKWELSGIPCKHALSAIHTQRLDPDDFVHPCYHVETYARVYSHFICPVNGPDKWKKTGKGDILPPNNGRGVGRLAGARRLGADEPSNKQKKETRGNKRNGKMKRQQTSMSCRLFGERGHNKEGCNKRKEEEARNQKEEPRKQEEEARMQEEEALVEETYGTNLEEEQGPCAAGQEKLDEQIWDQLFDWGQGTNWDQISMEVSNFEASIQVDSQSSVHIPEAASVPCQDGTKLTPNKKTKTQYLSKDPNILARAARSKIRFKAPSGSAAAFKAPSGPLTRSSSANATPSRVSSPAANKSFMFGPVPTPYFGPTPSRCPVTPAAPKPPIPSSSSKVTTSATKGSQAKGVRIRETCFSDDHPRVCVSRTTKKRQPLPPPFKVTEKEGKKYVTMKNLSAALDSLRAQNMELLKGKKAT
ncbi:hypothetical protein BUALT_Bualt12G0086300 [Buddleja alternifolia]|uniref:SWIM-type domain-containing protein n=1 Tax=Buddleja alternifolia TaxID=168488 RepID=A0AAV6WVX8_9LAMI|nr:hypothetical protein BUALT_Bualt12G0086300 [Buddleja alternifolia]